MMFEEKIKAQIVFALAISDCGFQRFFCQEKRCESSYSLLAARKERDSDATMPRDRKAFLKLMQTQMLVCGQKNPVVEHPPLTFREVAMSKKKKTFRKVKAKTT